LTREIRFEFDKKGKEVTDDRRREKGGSKDRTGNSKKYKGGGEACWLGQLRAYHKDRNAPLRVATRPGAFRIASGPLHGEEDDELNRGEGRVQFPRARVDKICPYPGRKWGGKKNYGPHIITNTRESTSGEGENEKEFHGTRLRGKTKTLHFPGWRKQKRRGKGFKTFTSRQKEYMGKEQQMTPPCLIGGQG